MHLCQRKIIYCKNASNTGGTMNRIVFGLGIVTLIAAGFWFFVIRNNFNQRFPAGWSWTVNSIGYSSFAEETGNWPENTTLTDDPINLTERTVTATTQDAPAGAVKLVDHYL